MGLTRFLMSSLQHVSADAISRVYFSGADGVPITSRVRAKGNAVEIDRDTSESGNYHLPWPVAGYGCLLLSTASLKERAAPYLLALELARGTLNQLRNQAADWLEIGLLLPVGFADGLKRAIRLFAEAATSQHDLAACETRATDALGLTLTLGDQLVSAFVEQAIAVRKRQSGPLTTWLGGALDQTVLDHSHGRKFLGAFNAALLALNWRHVEPTEGTYQWRLSDQQLLWCQNHHMHVMAGPLVVLDANGCPDWLCLWQGNFENLVSLVTDYVETAVDRYRGRVQLWNCAARFATGDALSLSEEESLQLAVRGVEIVRRMDPDTPAVLTFDQPWAEYMQHTHRELSPLHTADALLRSDLGLAGIALELNVGYRPHASDLRATLALNRLLDWWSSFGLPIYILLTVPSSSGPDPKARSQFGTLGQTSAEDWTPNRQSEWTARYVSLLLAKPTVRGIFWNQWRDDEPHSFPHGGLWDIAGHEKPSLANLKRLRKLHLA